MALTRAVCSLLLACGCAGWANGQGAPAPVVASRLAAQDAAPTAVVASKLAGQDATPAPVVASKLIAPDATPAPVVPPIATSQDVTPTSVVPSTAAAQDVAPASVVPSRPARQDATLAPVVLSTPNAGEGQGASALHETIPLIVPEGMAIQIALDDEVRIRKIGQVISGHVVEPVYAFDKLVVPVGTKVTGEITKIEGISTGERTLNALNAEFSPAHKIEVEFTEFILPDGKHLPVHTRVTPGSGQVIQFVTAKDPDKTKDAKDVAAEKAKEAKARAKREWNSAMEQVKQPGKLRKVERYAIAQLPVHPQYIDAGTVYLAELRQPLDFGTEPLSPQLAESLRSPPPDGAFVRARLVTALNSATSQKGDEVEAMLSRPLLDGERLILPQGAILKGSVIQVQPARYMSRNGQLRFVFHDLVLPGGLDEKVSAVLGAVESAKSDNLKLDSEGGAQATSPKTRYLQTGIALGLAVVSGAGDGDADVLNKSAGGAGGFKLVGIVVGIVAHSQPLGIAMGALGAGRSVYIHFVARGRDVVFPENTAMEIGIGVRAAPSEKPAQQ
jgi:hypothetical protein